MIKDVFSSQKEIALSLKKTVTMRAGACIPVSYTHLDVYKRQGKDRNFGRYRKRALVYLPFNLAHIVPSVGNQRRARAAFAEGLCCNPGCLSTPSRGNENSAVRGHEQYTLGRPIPRMFRKT